MLIYLIMNHGTIVHVMNVTISVLDYEPWNHIPLVIEGSTCGNCHHSDCVNTQIHAWSQMFPFIFQYIHPYILLLSLFIIKYSGT